MNEIFELNSAAFCMNIMEKLDSQGIDAELIRDILNELCVFFGFSDGFMYYQSDHYRTYLGTIVSTESSRSDSDLPDHLDMNEQWEDRILEEVHTSKIVISTREQESDLARDFRNMLRADSFVMLPVIDENKQMSAMIGLAGYNKSEPLSKLNQLAIYTILVIISNHIKVWLSLKQIDRIEEAMAAIVDNMGVDIYVNDFFTHEVLYVNRSMALPYGGPAAMVGDKCWRVLYDDKTGQCEFCPQKKLIDDEGKPTKVYSWNYERPFDHSWFRVLSAAFTWGDGRLAHIVSSIDITENIRNEELIRVIAEYDNLTGISNRRKLFIDCETMLERCKKNQEAAYVLFFDLNKFKQVNDIYGHRAGDELLGQIGAYLISETPYGDCSYRYGGDEFVLLFSGVSKAQVMQAARMIYERFSKPWHLSCCDAVCFASIGISVYDPASDLDATTLINQADDAMYESKQNQGKEIIVYQKTNRT